MQKETITNYAKLGGRIMYLRHVQTNSVVKGDKGIIATAEKFIQQLEDLSLFVTLRAGKNLIAFKERITTTKQDYLTEEECAEMFKIIDILFHTFLAEIEGAEIFLITDKRYSIDKLTEKIDTLFSEDVFYNLPELAQYDIKESGKCILYECSTAAAFHILRATESILKLYYKKYLRRKLEKKTWGQLLNELQNKTRGKLPNRTTVNHLKNIKDSFRNPTQHPEMTYNINEVQDLFNICIDVINRMSNEMK